MREPILIACAVYLGGLLACYAYVAYRWMRDRKRAWGEMGKRRRP